MEKFTRNKVGFIIGGAQKAGTTSLYYHLKRHPEIGMSNAKEPRFFDNESMFSKGVIDYSMLHKFFNFGRDKKIYGEASPNYFYWESACERIYKYNPSMKMVFILRNPVERAFSHWNMMRYKNKDNETFSQAIRNEEKRNAELYSRIYQDHSYINRGMYADKIKRFKRYFPERQLLFIKYDNYRNNPERILNIVLDFLGVDVKRYKFRNETRHNLPYVNKISPEDKRYLIHEFKNDVYKVERLLNWDCKNWLI